MSKKRRVLVVGWDAADWKFLNPLIDEGLMPTLQGLVEGGSMGRLATLDPPLSPTLWTSIATGKRPYKHGIHGFTEPDPSGEGIRPIYSTNRKVKAIWNMLTLEKLKTHVVGWWPSHPAEPINGVMVSNFFQRPHDDITKPWGLPKGTVHPASQQELYAKLRIHPQELTSAHLEPFIPELAKINQKKDRRPYGAVKTLAECSSIHSAATYILENEEWDFMAVYYDAIDHFCHGFMKYHPPYREHIDRQSYEYYKDVVNAGCRYHDMMLARLLELAGPDTTVVLVSDHGFHPDHHRPKAIPKEPAGPAIEHSPYGIIVMNGPGIKKDASIFGASLLDVTPTLLHLLGLPVGEDMDGKVLINAFEDPDPISSIDSWENVEGEDGSHPENLEVDLEEASQELKQLIELGYVEDPGANSEKAVRSTINENNYNLARAYINGNKWNEAIPILESLVHEDPNALRFGIRLVNAYQQTGKFKQARKAMNNIREHHDRQSPRLDVAEGMLLLAEHRVKKALALFEKAEREGGNQPNLQLRIANAYLQLNKLDAAEAAVRKALAEDPESEIAHATLGQIYRKQMRFEDALDAFMDSIGLLYYQPIVHYYIGETLVALEMPEKGAAAMETTLKLAPGYNKVRQRLIELYTDILGQPGKAKRFKLELKQKTDGTITIVSGLPRSGTSMMMQMLDAGGYPIFTDGERTADENNKKGYYEHQAVMALQKNKTFLKDAKGKAVKVIAQLLPALPMRYNYRIIFMERDLLEVVSSQQKMLVRNGNRVQSDVLPLGLLEEYKQTIDKIKTWAAQHPTVEIIYLPYRDVVESPFGQAVKVSEFLNGDLIPERMISAVDANLYRERGLPLSE